MTTTLDDFDDFAELEAELNAAIKEVQDKKAAEDAESYIRRNLKAARHRINTTLVSQKEREELLKKIAEWEEATIWITTAVAAMFSRQACSCCGHITTAPIGYYKHQIGRKNQKDNRWVRVQHFELLEIRASEYPGEVIFQDSTSDFCLQCLDVSRYDIQQGKVKCLAPAMIERLQEQERGDGKQA